jgi:hypothetical protein
VKRREFLLTSIVSGAFPNDPVSSLQTAPGTGNFALD